MKIWALGLALFWLGCANTRQYVEPVTVVPTRTPGVTFVIVRPTFAEGHKSAQRAQPGDGSNVNAASWYMMLCDARPVDGMHCAVPTEAAVARYSYAPANGSAATPIDQGVGTLADFSTHLSRDKDDRDDAKPADATPTPAPAAAPAPVPPTPPSPTPPSATKGAHQ